MRGLEDGHGDEGDVGVGRFDHTASLLAIITITAPTSLITINRHRELLLKFVLTIALGHWWQIIITGVGVSIGVEPLKILMIS